MIEKALRDRILKSLSREAFSNSQCQVPNPYQQVARPTQPEGVNNRKAFTSEGIKRADRFNNVYKLRQALESQYSVNNETNNLRVVATQA